MSKRPSGVDDFVIIVIIICCQIILISQNRVGINKNEVLTLSAGNLEKRTINRDFLLSHEQHS